jgi:adenylosuccinate lyase
MEDHSIYQTPLTTRYASEWMSGLFSDKTKFSTWRKLWVALAKCQKELGLERITDEILNDMQRFVDDIDFNMAKQFELELHHDVMAHIHTFGTQCPAAMPILHLGATSCFVGDNADLIIMRQGLKGIGEKLEELQRIMATRAEENKDKVCVSYTHGQAAQMTTIGKRIVTWMYNFQVDQSELLRLVTILPMRGVKGTTGTQESFLLLFNNDAEKVKLLDQGVCREMGFDRSEPVTGQTYNRKWDKMILNVLSGIAESCHKLAQDLRLLASSNQFAEPFSVHQTGSSAMPYKQNPIKSEQVCSLSRLVCANQMTSGWTFASQWLERSLDDSAGRRIYLPESFLAVDGMLETLKNVMKGGKFHYPIIQNKVEEHIPYHATERLMMFATLQPEGNRQELHEALRVHSIQAKKESTNDLFARLAADPLFANIDLSLYQQASYGLAAKQVDDFLETYYGEEEEETEPGFIEHRGFGQFN